MASYPDNNLKNPITVIGCGSEHADFQGLFDSKSVSYALYRVVRAVYMLNEYMYHFVSPACVQFTTVTCAPHLLYPNTSVADVHFLLYVCMLTSCFPALTLLTSCFPALYMHAHFLFTCSLSYSLPGFLVLLHEQSFLLLTPFHLHSLPVYFSCYFFAHFLFI